MADFLASIAALGLPGVFVGIASAVVVYKSGQKESDRQAAADVRADQERREIRASEEAEKDRQLTERSEERRAEDERRDAVRAREVLSRHRDNSVRLLAAFRLGVRRAQDAAVLGRMVEPDEGHQLELACALEAVLMDAGPWTTIRDSSARAETLLNDLYVATRYSQHDQVHEAAARLNAELNNLRDILAARAEMLSEHPTTAQPGQ